MRWLTPVTCVLLCAGCRSRGIPPPAQTLEAYAAQLPAASEPGPQTRRLVTSLTSATDPPDERLAVLYRHVMQVWEYVPDPEGQDGFRRAEDVLAGGPLQGDCEDACAILVAICRVLHLDCRVCLGESGKSGHAWVEVLISKEPRLDPTFRDRLLKRFGRTAALVSRKEGHWLQLSPPGSLTRYRATHAITISGELVPLSPQ
jgi:transglutaminase-like putative cysteine protease